MKIVNITIVIVALLAGLIMPLFYNIQPVIAAGSTTVTFNMASGNWAKMSHTQTTGLNGLDYACFNYLSTTCSSFVTSGNPQIGWYSDLQTSYDPDVHRTFPRDGMFGWNISSIPADAEILSANITIMVSSKTDNSPLYNDFYWSIYKTNAGADNTLNINDFDNYRQYTDQYRIVPPQHYNELADVTVHSMEITADLDVALETDSGGNVWFQILTENQGLHYSPTWESDAGIRFDMAASNGGYPKLTITYVAPPVRGNENLHTNVAVNTTPLGTETADNITLETLRCMYSDETLSFLVNGDSGANVTLELLDQDNQVLETHSDSIRTDGIYSWQLSLSSNYAGIVRVKELNNGLYSDYVSVQPAPSSTEATNKIYAGSTIYPQYTNAFSSYVVYDDDVMYVHYKTNIDPASELGSYYLSCYSNGRTAIWNKRMDLLAGQYFGGTIANQQALSHWRYVVFTPAQVTGDDYGGLIINLNMDDARSIRTGFIEYRIETSVGGTLLAGTHSAYWYLSGADKGISFTIPANITEDEKLVCNLTVGTECKVENNLSEGNILIADEQLSGFTAELGQNTITTKAGFATGTHVISLTLNQAEYTTYQYRYDVSLIVNDSTSTGGTEGIADPNSILSLLKNIFGFFDTSSASSHWIYLIVGMGLLVALFWFSSILRVVMPLLLFGAACVAGWIDRWWVVLLALGAGVFIYGIFKKKTSGGEE